MKAIFRLDRVLGTRLMAGDACRMFNTGSQQLPHMVCSGLSNAHFCAVGYRGSEDIGDDK